MAKLFGMRALLALVLAVLIPLQMAWAVAGDACAEHAFHGAMADAGAADGLDAHDHPADDPVGDERNADVDCHDACHHYTAMVVQTGQNQPLTLGANAPAPRLAAALGLSSPRPERPQWPGLA